MSAGVIDSIASIESSRRLLRRTWILAICWRNHASLCWNGVELIEEKAPGRYNEVL